MESVLHMTRRRSRPKEMQKSRINFDEEAVRKCCDLLKQWPPMFSSSTSIVSLSSGMNASTEVRKLRAQLVGKEKAVDFIEQRIKKSNVGFYDTIKKSKLKTFTTMLEQQKLSVNGKDVVIRADRELFARLLIIREKRGINIKELLKYSLGPIAWSLATPQGNIFKSVKSKLLKDLEEKITFVDPCAARICKSL